MYNIDKTLVTDVQSRLLANISEQLERMVKLLEAHFSEQVSTDVIKIEPPVFKCRKCGASSDEDGPFTTLSSVTKHSKVCGKTK